MRGPVKSLDPADQFKRSVTHLTANVVFDLAALSSLLVGSASLHGDDVMIKYTIATTISMATSYCPSSLVTKVEIRSVETTVTVVYGAGRRRG